MKLTLRDLDQGWQAVKEFARTEMPAHLAFRAARAVRQLQPEADALSMQSYELIRKHTPEDTPEDYHIRQNPDYIDELNQLLATEIEIDLEQIRPEELLELKTPVQPILFISAWFLFADD